MAETSIGGMDSERAFLDGKTWKYALDADIFVACNKVLGMLGKPPQ